MFCQRRSTIKTKRREKKKEKKRNEETKEIYVRIYLRTSTINGNFRGLPDAVDNGSIVDVAVAAAAAVVG